MSTPARSSRAAAKQRWAVARSAKSRLAQDQEPSNSMTLDVTHGGFDLNSNRLGGLGIDSRGDLTIGLGNGTAYDTRTGELEIKAGGVTIEVGGNGGHHHHQAQTQTFDPPTVTYDPPTIDVAAPDPYSP